jgi:hypothetical protein
MLAEALFERAEAKGFRELTACLTEAAVAPAKDRDGLAHAVDPGPRRIDGKPGSAIPAHSSPRRCPPPCGRR